MTHWTEKQYAEFAARAGEPFKLPANDPGAFARGQLPSEKMNKTESAYDAHLWNRRHSGQILWHAFEAITLRLAPKTTYTPDFLLLTSDLFLEVHETKGFIRDDAIVKLKTAAKLFPFRFKLVRKGTGGIWDIKEIGGPAPDPHAYLEQQVRRAAG